jgi:hypothetical protein
MNSIDSGQSAVEGFRGVFFQRFQCGAYIVMPIGKSFSILAGAPFRGLRYPCGDSLIIVILERRILVASVAVIA